MTVRHMKIFVCLYENKGNVTKTADMLYMAQPAVSVALSELEEHYKIKLFDRISRRLYINDAGTRMYGYARRILNMFNDMETGMKNMTDEQILRIGCCDSMDACGLPKYISAFTDIHPGITIHSCVDTGESLIEKILNGELDLAIVDKACPNRNIVNDEFIAADMVFGVAPSRGYTEGQHISISELVKQPLLLRERGSGARIVFDAAMSNFGYQPRPTFESVGNTFTVNAVIQGLGICCLPKNIMDRYHKRGKILYLNVDGLDIKMSYKIIYNSDRELTERAKDFIEMCRDFNNN